MYYIRTRTYVIVNIIFYIDLRKIKKSYSPEIDQLLKHVEEKISDVLLPEGVVTKQELIGKGLLKRQLH